MSKIKTILLKIKEKTDLKKNRKVQYENKSLKIIKMYKHLVYI